MTSHQSHQSGSMKQQSTEVAQLLLSQHHFYQNNNKMNTSSQCIPDPDYSITMDLDLNSTSTVSGEFQTVSEASNFSLAHPQQNIPTMLLPLPDYSQATQHQEFNCEY